MNRSIVKYKSYYVFLLPAIAYFFIFRYIPMASGILLSFKDYKIGKGIWHSSWAGFKYFEEFLTSGDFYQVLGNTFIISLYHLAFGFTAPIVLALLLNEIRHTPFKRSVQTIIYLPHFLSWVVLGGLIIMVLSPTSGFVNSFLGLFGIKPIFFLSEPKYFRGILVLSAIWKEAGWGTIIYLAAIVGIDPSLYESALVDGASRLQRMVRITLPCLLPTIVIMFILRIGYLMDAGFEQIFILYNPVVYSVSDIIDTFVYRNGLLESNYSYSSAVGLFKSVVGLALVIGANYITKKVSKESLW